MVRGLCSHRASRFLFQLRGIRSHHRLDVQSARKMAGEIEAGARVARAHPFHQSPDYFCRLAAGPQWFLSSGSGFSRLGHQQERECDAHLLTSGSEHPHGLSDRDFDTLFTKNKPVIFNFHGYPTLIHKLAYRRANHENLHVHGYREKGNINTPLELAIRNQVDRFSLAIDVIDRVPGLATRGAHAKDRLKNQIVESINYAYAEGIDSPEIRDWEWPS